MCTQIDCNLIWFSEWICNFNASRCLIWASLLCRSKVDTFYSHSAWILKVSFKGTNEKTLCNHRAFIYPGKEDINNVILLEIVKKYPITAHMKNRSCIWNPNQNNFIPLSDISLELVWHRSQLTLLMIYFSSIILNRVECNCFVCWYAWELWFRFRVGWVQNCVDTRMKSEVHKLSFAPAAYLPLHCRLSTSKLLCTGRQRLCQHNPDI